MVIKSATVWETSDGRKHSSLVLAEQHDLTRELIAELDEPWRTGFFTEPQDVLNFLSNRRKLVFQWLESCEALEREAFKP